MYPATIAAANCRVTLAVDGRATVETGAHDIGTGLYTVVAQTAADGLGLPIDRITVRLGDTNLPAAPLTAGSSGTASICTVVAKACRELCGVLTEAAVKDAGPLHGLSTDGVSMRDGKLVAASGAVGADHGGRRRVNGGAAVAVETSYNPNGSPPLIGPMLIRRGLPVLISGVNHRDAARYSFGAQLVEVRVNRHTAEVRVPRLVGAYAAGRIVNPRTARSQLSGGQVWGVGSALLEATEIDRRTARYTNADLAEYHVATAADVPDVTTIIVPEDDPQVNPMGVKGVGELGVVGLNAAIANGVYHATGLRVRKLPIRVDAELLRATAEAGSG